MEKTYELLSLLINGKLKDENFSEHLWKEYDGAILAQLFSKLKAMADDAFRTADYAHGIEYYTGCILLVRNSFERSKLYSNRSICFVKLHRYEEAYSDSLKCIALSPQWPKAWYRCSAALQQLNEPERAYSCLRLCAKYMEQDKAGSSDVIKAELTELENEVRLLKRKERYHLDYKRFDNLARVIEEQEQTYAAANENHIEFAAEGRLSDEQQAFLKAQLTGDAPPSPDTFLQRKRAAELNIRTTQVELDWRKRLRTSTDSRALTVLREFLVLQHLSSYPQAVINLIDSGIAEAYAHKILTVSPPSSSTSSSARRGHRSAADVAAKVQDLSKKMKAVVIGGGSVVVPVLLKNRCDRITVFTDSVLHVDLIGAHFQADECALHFYPTSLLAGERAADDANVQPKKSVLSSVDENNETELNLRRKGEALVESVAQSDKRNSSEDTANWSGNDLVVLDPEFICPYLLGPNNPIKLLSKLSGRLLPSRITLNVALAKINHTPIYGGRYVDHYSALPLPLPSVIAQHVTLVTEFTPAWTLGAFSEMPGQKKGSHSVPSTAKLEIDLTLNKSSADSFNALIFSLVFFDGDSPIFDTWEVYQECCERNLEMKTLTPHFFWLTNPAPTAVATSPAATTTTNAVKQPQQSLTTPATTGHRGFGSYCGSMPKTLSPLRKIQSTDYTELVPRPSSSSHISSNSSSSDESAENVESSWVSELNKNARDDLPTPRAGAFSQPVILTPYRECYKIVLRLLHGAICGADVYTDTASYTSSEGVIAVENLSGKKWYVHDLFGPTRQPFGESATSMLHSKWLAGIAELRSTKCREVSDREKMIRAHMVISDHRTTFARVACLQVLHPNLAIELINVCLTRFAEFGTAGGIAIDVQCGLDLFCASTSALKLTRQLLKSPAELRRLKEVLTAERKAKPTLDWHRSHNYTAPVSETPGSVDRMVEEVRKILFTNGYLKLDRGDIVELRPPTAAMDRSELLKALAILHNCPPTTPGIDSTENCQTIKQRYDVLVYETPESLYDLIDWVQGSYLRKLLYAKAALTEKHAYFYPRQLKLKAFLAYIPPSIGAIMDTSNLRVLRNYDDIITWDAISNGIRVSDIQKVVSFQLNSASMSTSAFQPKTLTFNLRRSRSPLKTSDNGHGADDAADETSSTEGYCNVPFDEPEEMSFYADRPDVAKSTAEGDVAPPLASSIANESISCRLDVVPPPVPTRFNAMITFSEYGLTQDSGFSNCPCSLVKENTNDFDTMPHPRQRFHALPETLLDSDTDQVSIFWQMNDQMSDYSFSVPRTLKTQTPASPPADRITNALNQISQRHSEIAMNLGHLMTMSKEATVEIQKAALALSPFCENVDSIIFSSLN